MNDKDMVSGMRCQLQWQVSDSLYSRELLLLGGGDGPITALICTLLQD